MHETGSDTWDNATRTYTYLSELDSVRRTKSEVDNGKRVLFHEIVCTGNDVVLF